MLDIGWAELMVIGTLALIVVGPKELPRLLRKNSRLETGDVVGAVDIATVTHDIQIASASRTVAVIRCSNETSCDLGPGFVIVHVIDLRLQRIVSTPTRIGDDHDVIMNIE